MIMIEKIKYLINEIRHDPDSLHELKQMFYGLVIVVGVIYGFQQIYVQSSLRKWNEMQEQQLQIQSKLGKGEAEASVVSELTALRKKVKALEANIELLTFKEKMFREEYLTENSERAFTNVIFTLLPRSPVDMEDNIAQMSTLETQSFEYYDVLPVNVQGMSDFSRLLTYLQYIEQRSEVGLIDQLKIKIEENPPPFAQNAKVHFDINLGRIKLH